MSTYYFVFFYAILYYICDFTLSKDFLLTLCISSKTELGQYQLLGFYCFVIILKHFRYSYVYSCLEN
ncbi:uncharacterized protein B0P05DRAFT_524093 [Gilbertella persicaria]|uniref:uncharacterized protein n=1 Tax=Gilbertella persicaria TaxID=101096 RepID=UPI0022205678|nr:uncharacterized protein B0P05DRAFT_524093 [Gilbertella persicaria]KAI8094952.1 hypothetical protein B0P05DRAFT_524093 [Gilbertella persicaria]